MGLKNNEGVQAVKNEVDDQTGENRKEMREEKYPPDYSECELQVLCEGEFGIDKRREKQEMNWRRQQAEVRAKAMKYVNNSLDGFVSGLDS